MTSVLISALWLYPIKSLAGIEVHSATLTQAGLRGDREWMIVDEDGLFVSQRKLPYLATIHPSYTSAGTLQLSDANASRIDVPEPEGDTIQVRIWRDECAGIPASPHINQWLTTAARSPAPLTLVRFDKHSPRPVDQQRFGLFTTHFADAAPLLVANEASLQALNAHLQAQAHLPVDMRRFRPNIVIDGLPPFAEHQHKRMCGEAYIEIALKDHCQRCSIITIDQTTGEPSRDASPFKQLAQLNSMPGKAKAPAFGVNSVLTAGEGQRVRCGDRFEVCE